MRDLTNKRSIIYHEPTKEKNAHSFVPAMLNVNVWKPGRHEWSIRRVPFEDHQEKNWRKLDGVCKRYNRAQVRFQTRYMMDAKSLPLRVREGNYPGI